MIFDTKAPTFYQKFIITRPGRACKVKIHIFLKIWKESKKFHVKQFKKRRFPPPGHKTGAPPKRGSPRQRRAPECWIAFSCHCRGAVCPLESVFPMAGPGVSSFKPLISEMYRRPKYPVRITLLLRTGCPLFLRAQEGPGWPDGCGQGMPPLEGRLRAAHKISRQKSVSQRKARRFRRALHVSRETMLSDAQSRPTSRTL